LGWAASGRSDHRDQSSARQEPRRLEQARERASRRRSGSPDDHSAWRGQRAVRAAALEWVREYERIG
jgi:hypothetical protein